MTTDTAAADVTRFALLTSPNPGAIAVIALRGPAARRIVALATRLAAGDDPPELPDGRVCLCRAVDGDETIDDVLVVGWDGGHRAELSLHGGMRVVQRVMSLLERLGAVRVAALDDDPASERDRVLREIDAALQTAHTVRLTRWLLVQRRVLPEFICRRDPAAAADPLLARRANAAMRLLRGARVALVGPPNAGKSTLANRLIGHERIITADHPGTTRDWVSETAVVHGWPIMLTDTAGVRPTDDALEAESIRRGIGQARRADLVLLVLDASDPPAPMRETATRLLQRLPDDQPRLIVINKIDLARALAPDLGGASWLGVSAALGDGLDDLARAVVERLDLHLLEDDAPTPIAARQARLLGLTADSENAPARADTPA